MKSFVAANQAWAVALAALIIAAACGGPASSPAATFPTASVAPSIGADVARAKAEGAVVWYTISGNDKTFQAVKDAFRAKYGIEVQPTVAGAAQLLERYSADSQRGNSPDLLQLSDITAVEKLIKSGDYVAYEPAGAKADYPSSLLTYAPFAYPYSLSIFGISYNTNLAGKDPATFGTWDQFVDAKWSGKIGMTDPNLVGGSLTATWILRKSLGDAGWKSFEERLAALKVKMYPSNTPLAAALASGEIAVGWASASFINSQIGTGAPLGYSYPKATPLIYPLVGIVKGAKHPNAAKLFLDWFTSVEGQEVWSGAYGDAPANPKATWRSDMSKQSWYVPLKQVPADYIPPTPDQLKSHLDEFNRIVLGR